MSYALRRSARIFPGLWSCILATLLAAMALGIHVPLVQGLVWVATQMIGLIYTPAFLAGFGIGSYNTSLWTIPVELQFYVVVIAVYAVAQSLGVRRAATGIFLIFTAISIALYTTWLPPLGAVETGVQKLVRYSFVPHFYLFMAGVVIREWGLHNTRLLRNRGLYWIAAYVAFRLLVPSDVLHHPLENIIGRLLLAVAVISVAYTLPTLSERILRNETDISYGIYIYHGLMINVMVMLGMSGMLSGLFCVLLLTPTIATLSWFFIEKPSLTYAHSWHQRAKVKSEAAFGGTGIGGTGSV